MYVTTLDSSIHDKLNASYQVAKAAPFLQHLCALRPIWHACSTPTCATHLPPPAWDHPCWQGLLTQSVNGKPVGSFAVLRELQKDAQDSLLAAYATNTLRDALAAQLPGSPLLTIQANIAATER